MKKSLFSKGSIVRGILFIIIGRIFYAYIIYGSQMRSQDYLQNLHLLMTYIPTPALTSQSAFPENALFGFIFTRIIIILGIVEIIRGILTIRVKKHGFASDGKILKLWYEERTDSNRTTSTTYYVKFAYENSSGQIMSTKESVSRPVYKCLKQMAEVPILVYKDKAITDIDRIKRISEGLYQTYRPMH